MSGSLSDIFKFNVSVSIPPNLLENESTSRRPLESTSLNHRPPIPNYLPQPGSSVWGGSIASRNGSRSVMPPPLAPVLPRKPYQHTFVDDSVLPYNADSYRMLHSTPLHSVQGSKKPQSLFRPPMESTLASSNFSGVGSAYRGSESVYSLSSNNADFIDKLLQRGLNKFLAKGRFNPEYEDLAIQVANGLKFCVQEAALELAPGEGSVRSHFSKHVTTWRSGMSTISGKSHSTIHSLHKTRQVTPQASKKVSPAKCIECSMGRVNKTRKPYGRITEEPDDAHIPTTFSVVEKTIQPSKRSLSPDDNERECSVPQTVRKRLNVDDCVTSTTAVQVIESPTSISENVNRADRSNLKGKNAKPTFIDALAGRTGILTIDDENDFRRTPAATKRKAAPKKAQPKAQAQNNKKKENKKSSKSASSVSITALAIVTISTTRSGRAVKQPSFYQVPGLKKKTKKTANVNNDESANNKSSSGKVEVPTAEKPKVTKKPAARKAAKPPTPVVEDPAPTTFTKRGRPVKATVIYGAIKNLTPSPAVTNIPKSKAAAKKASPKKGKTAKPTKAKKSPKKKDTQQPEATTRTNLNDSDEDLSMSGIDFYIPEVTQSTRRGAKPKNATEKSLAVQTPPLTHFTANLHSGIIASASNTGKTTPDWKPSQRTEAEAKELQKRKLGPRKKKPVKEPMKKVRPLRKSPSISQRFLQLARKSIADKLRCNDSANSSYDSEME